MTGRGGGARALAAGLFLSLAGCATAPAPALSPADQASVGQVQAWFDGLHDFTADFIQVWPNGAVGAGRAAFDPPGHLRLDYLPRGSMTLVADGGHIVFTDERTGSVTRMATRASPLGLLLEGHVQLGGDIRVTDVQRATGVVQLSMTRASDPAQGLLTLTFSDVPRLDLTGIEAVDAEGRHTRFHLTNESAGS